MDPKYETERFTAAESMKSLSLGDEAAEHSTIEGHDDEMREHSKSDEHRQKETSERARDTDAAAALHETNSENTITSLTMLAPPARASIQQIVLRGKALLKVNEAPAKDLIENIWSRLPEEVMDLVLAWLPLSAFFRMRCVCKKWNHIISSPNFLNTYSRVPFRTAFFLHLIKLNGVLTAACHDPTNNRWQRLPLDSIPVNAYIHGGAGGLFCCQRVVNSFLVLSVCNPLTKKWRDLPPMPNLNASTCFVKMIANPRNNTYKIVRVGQLQPLPTVRNNGARIELCTEVYESATDSWGTVEHTPTDLRFIQGSSICDGAVQCRTSTTRRMIAFDTARKRWIEVFARNLGPILDSKLVDCDGLPHLVTRAWKGGQMESIDVWRQKPRFASSSGNGAVDPFSDVEWEEVDRMPPSLFRQWCSIAGPFYHVGVGCYIYSTCLARNDTKLVTYNLLTKKWQLVEGFPVSHINTFLGGYEFRPRLDAAV
ncbi:F-box/kelch-repeat protein At5g15710 isoform X1 [Physcomitrium patens]